MERRKYEERREELSRSEALAITRNKMRMSCRSLKGALQLRTNPPQQQRHVEPDFVS
jgi:hypothetical protein